MAVRKIVSEGTFDWIIRPLGQDRLLGGMPAPWMPAGVRILHAMWEAPGSTHEVSHHEAHVAAVIAGDLKPDMVGNVDMNTVGRVTGIRLEMERPPRGWRRLWWSEVADRIGIQLDARQGVLEAHLRPFTQEGSWPASVLPPPEGTLDTESFTALTQILAGYTHGPTIAYTAKDEWYRDGGFVRGTLDEIVSFSLKRRCSPNNWWPEDHSWLVWSDCDLLTSAVFGSTQLIAAIENNQDLETLPYRDVWWPQGSDLNAPGDTLSE
jgi:hypothetical protein